MVNGDENLCVAPRPGSGSPCHTLTPRPRPFGSPYGFIDCCFVLPLLPHPAPFRQGLRSCCGPGSRARPWRPGLPGSPEICSRNDYCREATLLYTADGPQPRSKTHMAGMGAVLFPLAPEKRSPGELGDLPKVTSLVSGQAGI